MGEDVKLINKVDTWAQDNDSKLSAEFNRYYKYAADTSYGWESVQESSPELFADALKIAKLNKHRL